MRIVSGKFASRHIEAPKGLHTRPTLDKVREAVFSSLGGKFSGGLFLDLYAGSGANGLEAISRGMDKAYFVDKDKSAIDCIKSNIESLACKDECEVYKMNDLKALEHFKEVGLKFMVVYLDPPFAKQQNDRILSYLNDSDMLVDGAIVVIESDKKDSFTQIYSHLYPLKEVIYGQCKITYYKEGVLEE